MSKDFLFEIGTEEIPAGAMPKIIKQVEELSKVYLSEERINYEDMRVLGTPRRVALLIKGLDEKASDLKEKHKGPSVAIAYDENKNPTKAAIGFAKGKGVDVSQLVVEDGYIYVETSTSGKEARHILQCLMPHIINHLSFPKSMHWGNYEERFIRPVRWFVALLDEEVLPLSLASAKSSSTTRGHRFLGKSEITIVNPKSYVDALRDNYIIVDQEERKSMIVKQLEAIAKEKKGKILWDDDLLEEVVYLVEYPTALCGSFSENYLALPDCAVVTPMKDHQRYFPMVDGEGRLMNNFLTVRNGNDKHIRTVQAGNERVLRARLEDAKFFFDEDRKTPLVKRLEALKKIVFQEGLGNMRDKTDRLIQLCIFIAGECNLSDAEVASLERSCLLSKTDLTTGMVTEFTELQGQMGKEYALLDGEDAVVSEAIFEQYLPRFAGDKLPHSNGGRILSIADKVDNIVATFSRGLIPTGSQDPYALRRQTIGILNILIESGWSIDLTPIFKKSATLLGVEEGKQEELLDQLKNFFALRLKNIYLDRQWPHEVIDLLLSRKFMTVASNEAIGKGLIENKIYENTELVQAYTRIYNLVKQINYEGIREELFTEKAEKDLYMICKGAYDTSISAYNNEDYQTLVTIPTTLVDSINYFFESVMVMDKDEAVKMNRLQLLRMVYETFAVLGEVSALK